MWFELSCSSVCALFVLCRLCVSVVWCGVVLVVVVVLVLVVCCLMVLHSLFDCYLLCVVYR